MKSLRNYLFNLKSFSVNNLNKDVLFYWNWSPIALTLENRWIVMNSIQAFQSQKHVFPNEYDMCAIYGSISQYVLICILITILIYVIEAYYNMIRTSKQCVDFIQSHKKQFEYIIFLFLFLFQAYFLSLFSAERNFRMQWYVCHNYLCIQKKKIKTITVYYFFFTNDNFL